jgi:hypothetical protein
MAGKRRRGKRVFSYEEALATFPSVRDLTAAAVRQVESLVNAVAGREDAEERAAELETAYQAVVEAWAAEVMALGCEVKGLWLVDWDSGDGYYCWRYPEESIGYFHTYEDGFAGRLPIN